MHHSTSRAAALWAYWPSPHHCGGTLSRCGDAPVPEIRLRRSGGMGYVQDRAGADAAGVPIIVAVGLLLSAMATPMAIHSIYHRTRMPPTACRNLTLL